MIKAEFRKSVSGNWVGFTLTGHANYAPRGFDIVCSSVSILTIAITNALPEAITEQLDGYVLVEMVEVNYDSNLLIQTLIDGLKGISDQYGEKYLTVELLE